MKAVVTGGAGFIGSHLCERLVRRGANVVAIDDLSTGRLENLRSVLPPDVCPGPGVKSSKVENARFTFCLADVCDSKRITDLLRGADVLFHQAAIPSVQRSVKDPIQTNRANVEGTLRVLLAAREAGVRRVVFASSSSVYGDALCIQKGENLTPNPLSPYAVSKLVCELYARIGSHMWGLNVTGLRYFNVFGPRQDPASEYSAVIPRFISMMLNGRSPVIFGDGEQSRDFTFVENVVKANILAGRSRTTEAVLNVGAGQQITLNRLVEELNEILGTEYEPRYAPARLGDVRHSLADIALAKKEIGYEPGVSFRTGLEETVDWFMRAKRMSPGVMVRSGYARP